MNNILIEIANELDKKGYHSLADRVDGAIKYAKSSSKTLDDDIKKDLLKFIAEAKVNMDKSVDNIEEMFRRLRYFNIDHLIKDNNLHKSLKEMKDLCSVLDETCKKMYVILYGKRPSKSDMTKLLDDLELSVEKSNNALDFFNAHKSENKDDGEYEDKKCECEDGDECECDEDEDDYGIKDEDIRSFWDKEDEHD